MPCRYDPTPAEIEAGRKANEERIKTPLVEEVTKSHLKVSAAQKEINELTYANNALSVRVDYLQDLIWRMNYTLTVDGRYSDEVEDELDRVLCVQEKHRKADLDRLVRTLSQVEPIDYEKLGKVLAADTSKPLEPQLGFNPDNY